VHRAPKAVRPRYSYRYVVRVKGARWDSALADLSVSDYRERAEHFAVAKARESFWVIEVYDRRTERVVFTTGEER
jgi:hypothetical protein